jgi:hypothetical protein
MTMKPITADVVVVERKNNMSNMEDNFDIPDKEHYERFANELRDKLAEMKSLGLEDFSHLVTQGGVTISGIGLYYPAEVNDEGLTERNSKNGRYHMPTADSIEGMQWVTKHLWQNRMKDFALGCMMFAIKMLDEIIEGETDDTMIRESFAKDNPNVENPTQYQLAQQLMQDVIALIFKSEKAFFAMYKQVLEHEEPELVVIGDPRTVSNIVSGGYTSEALNKEEVLRDMNKPITDTDIEKFLSEVMKKDEEE